MAHGMIAFLLVLTAHLPASALAADGSAHLWANEFQQGYDVSSAGNRTQGHLFARGRNLPVSLERSADDTLNWTGRFGFWDIVNTEVIRGTSTIDVVIHVARGAPSSYHVTLNPDGSADLSGTTPEGRMFSGQLSADGNTFSLGNNAVWTDWEKVREGGFSGSVSAVDRYGRTFRSSLDLATTGSLNLKTCLDADPVLFTLFYITVFMN
jgi:hypothetical protein